MSAEYYRKFVKYRVPETGVDFDIVANFIQPQGCYPGTGTSRIRLLQLGRVDNGYMVRTTIFTLNTTNFRFVDPRQDALVTLEDIIHSFEWIVRPAYYKKLVQMGLLIPLATKKEEGKVFDLFKEMKSVFAAELLWLLNYYKHYKIP